MIGLGVRVSRFGCACEPLKGASEFWSECENEFLSSWVRALVSPFVRPLVRSSVLLLGAECASQKVTGMYVCERASC